MHTVRRHPEGGGGDAQAWTRGVAEREVVRETRKSYGAADLTVEPGVTGAREVRHVTPASVGAP